MEKWEEAHEIVLKVRAMNYSKDTLERAVGIMMHMLMDGGSDMTKIEPAANLILIARSPNGIQLFLDHIKPLGQKIDKELRTR